MGPPASPAGHHTASMQRSTWTLTEPPQYNINCKTPGLRWRRARLGPKCRGNTRGVGLFSPIHPGRVSTCLLTIPPQGHATSPHEFPPPQSTTCTTDTVRSAQLAEEIHMTHVTSSTSLHTVHHDAEAPATQTQHTYHITDGDPHRVCTCCAAAAQRLNTDVAADEQVAGWELQRSVQMAPGWGHGAGHSRSMMHSTQHVQGRAAGHHGWWRSQCFEFFL